SRSGTRPTTPTARRARSTSSSRAAVARPLVRPRQQALEHRVLPALCGFGLGRHRSRVQDGSRASGRLVECRRAAHLAARDPREPVIHCPHTPWRRNRRMRRIALIALVAGVAAAVMASPAFAINSVLKFEVKFSPNKVGTKKKPQAITLFTRPYYDTLTPDGDAPFAWKQARIFFPKEGVFNGKYFPSCPATKLTTQTGRNACKKAEIGKVDAKGFALGLVEPLKVKIYNLPGGKGIAMYLQGDNPVIIDHVVSGILTKVNTPLFGYKL